MTTLDAGFGAAAGRYANTPAEMTFEAWKDILWRVKNEFLADRITLIAAGASFYLLLALFPALAAFVSLYGFVADPVTIADHIAFLGGVLPSGGIELIRTQLQALATQNDAALSVTFIVGLLFALWSANSGIVTLFEALNVAYEEREKRSLVKLYATSLLFTLGAIIIGIAFIFAVGVVPALLSFVGLSGAEEILISILRWPALLIASAVAISILYSYGPSRSHAKWRWVTWGSALAAVVWLIASILFSWYLANFADYNATYGSLGAVIGFMLWTWISVVILLAGAELNAEMEHQTARDSTTGPELPMGVRGATMADTLGKSRNSVSAQVDAEQEAAEPLTFPDQQEAHANVGARRPPPLGTILGLALPVFALAAAIGLEVRDRRKVGQAREQPRPDEAALKQPLWERGRSFLESPLVREHVARVGRTAFDQAFRLMAEQAGKLRRGRR